MEVYNGDLAHRFVCACGRGYKNKSHLTRHRTYECGIVRQFSCDRCPYVACRKDHLKKHMDRFHRDDLYSFQ
ncbi:longitudinals lacking protein, isoforms A/B/D/L-like [Homalodisca vitripennis]|uniref:longitudinals lacking protein, isoforms A/B/D/L-like n=1 Tax=Homalodisca vitripennis TaxID=197043 RepID=UPI001EEB872E|nr:longitudinals lacking protein, isoforms A/B/D/L-like [Homalodisca vitripennis]XP_046663216.1 longitudinals lacking protein, isoforms A/B/D/L-like [Homalodisca vitripennis]